MGTINNTVLFPSTITKLGSAVDLGSEVQGTLPTSNGGLGTDFSAFSANQLLYMPSLGTIYPITLSDLGDLMNNVVIATSALELTYEHRNVFCNGTFTVQLPEVSGRYPKYNIKNIGVGVITVSAMPGNSIDDADFYTIDTQYNSIQPQGDAVSSWGLT